MRRPPLSFALGYHFGQLLIPLLFVGGVLLLLNAACPPLAAVGVVLAQSVPHQSRGMPYDDELYRHLIYDDDYDNPGAERSLWVLPYPNPKFYIRLAGPAGTTCAHNWRVTWREFHYWRAIVPIVAEQLTGTAYTERVRVGCEDREPEYGWIIVRYITPAEYTAETGDEWGDAWGRAFVGSRYGQIWMKWDGRPLPACGESRGSGLAPARSSFVH